jgi:translation elongation factor EF-4
MGGVPAQPDRHPRPRRLHLRGEPSLQACEGALLVVDAPRASRRRRSPTSTWRSTPDLEIIPVINKIDLPAAEPERCARTRGDPRLPARRGALASAKTGDGRRGRPRGDRRARAAAPGDPTAPLRALVFDCEVRPFKGVVAYVRVVDGRARRHAERLAHDAGAERFEILELGYFRPAAGADGRGRSRPARSATSPPASRNVARRRSATPSPTARPARRAGAARLQEAKPMVFAGIYPTDSDDYPELRDALEKLQLNDASLVYEPESSPRSASGSAAASSGCCTWRSSRSGSSASSTSTSSPRPRRGVPRRADDGGEEREGRQPGKMPDPARSSQDRGAVGHRPHRSRRPITSAR